MALAPGSNPDQGAQFANSQFYELALRTESRMSIIDESTFYTGSTQVTDSHAKNFEHKLYIYGAVFINTKFEYTTAQTR